MWKSNNLSHDSNTTNLSYLVDLWFFIINLTIIPATSRNQAIAARIALAVKKGDLPISKLKGASKMMYETMSMKELRHFTKVKNKELNDWKIKEDKKHGYFGTTDYRKRTITLNPKRGDLVDTIIHENLHKAHPDWEEKKVINEAKKREKNLSIRQVRDLLNKTLLIKNYG